MMLHMFQNILQKHLLKDMHFFCEFHLLHILKGTRLYKEYENGLITPLTMERYVDIIVRQLEVIPPEVIIQRLTGDGARDTLVAPLWSLKKFEVLNAIDKLMAERNTFQGRAL